MANLPIDFQYRMSEHLSTASCMCAERTSRSLSSSAASFNSSMASVAGQPFNVGAASRQLRLERLEAAIEMIDAMEHRFTLGGKGGDHQRHRCPEVGRHDLGAGQSRHA